MNIHIKSILAALSFSFLFYSNSLGLNLFLISIIVIILLKTQKKEIPISWGYSIAYLLSALFVFINPTGYSIFIYFMTFIVFIGKSISGTTSTYLTWLFGVINLLAASVINYNETEKQPDEKKKKLSSKSLSYIKGSLIALSLLIIFTLMYKNANPVFGNLISQINLDFISVPWLFFTLLGYVLFFHILQPYYPKELIELDNNQSNNLTKTKDFFSEVVHKKLSEEHTLGTIIFGALNLLLVFFLITDIIYLFEKDTIANTTYSQSVHQGIYALMFSIVCAITLILYFFRGNLNFYKENKRIKSFTFLWIVLNILLVAFTCFKNYQYVEALGFTYKRIGVFVYLLLTLIGLTTAYIKVVHIKNFIYLVRTNIALFFACVFISAAIPWDKMITLYNLKNIENPDIYYLINLGHTNSEQLYNYANNTPIAIESKKQINAKYTEFIENHYNKNWKEYTLYQFTKK